MTKVFIAMKWEDRDFAAALGDRLKVEGYEICSRWIYRDSEKTYGCMPDVAVREDIEDVEACAVFVIMGQRLKRTADDDTAARFVELGWIRRDKPVIWLTPPSNPYRHPYLPNYHEIAIPDAGRGQVYALMRARSPKRKVEIVIAGLLERLRAVAPPLTPAPGRPTLKDVAEETGVYKMSWPVEPNRGARGVDAWGAGGFGAPRDDQAHDGLDCVTKPGDWIVCPFTGKLAHVGFAYKDQAALDAGDADKLGTLHITGMGHWAGFRAEILYCRVLHPVSVGEMIPRGMRLAEAQDVAGYHATKAIHAGISRGRMTNHVHFRLKVAGKVVDPTPYFRGVENGERS